MGKPGKSLVRRSSYTRSFGFVGMGLKPRFFSAEIASWKLGIGRSPCHEFKDQSLEELDSSLIFLSKD